jgi:nitroreductase
LESIVRWKKEAAKKKGISITDLYENYKKYLEGIKRAPVFIIVFLDLEKGAASFTNGSVMSLLSNGYLYNSLRDSLFLCVENMLLEATALGLGSLYFELPGAAKTPVNKLFNIDNSYEYFTCIPIGYADEEPEPDDREVQDFLLANN